MGFNSFEFAAEVCFSLIGNLDTEARGNDTLNIWTDCTGDLTKLWQTGPSYMVTSGQMNIVLGYNNNPTAFNAWISNNLSDANNFSAQDITNLLKGLTQNWDSGSGSSSSTMMSEIQQFGNLISATQQIQTSTGDTETKSQASYIQQTTSSGQTQADMGNSAIGILSTIASLVMSSFL
jgi:hypothetical protein